MELANCLNCDKKIADKFCSNCGQKSETHRISFKNFISHDVLHGTFHIEKGMLFTARQALLRPGRAALEYIAGKRKRYYNVFYFILIVAGLNVFIAHVHNAMDLYLGRTIKPDPPFLNEASRKLNAFLDQSKLIISLFVPFAALNANIIFRRRGLNLAEHCILSGMILLGMALISLIGNIVFTLDLLIAFNNTVASVYGNTVILTIVGYIIFGYFNAFGRDYARAGFALRMLLFFIFLAFEAWLLLLLVVGILTDWQFYTVNIINLFG